MNKRVIIVAVIAIAMLAGFATQAFAASDNIVISAKVNSKLVLTVGGDYSFDGGTGFEPDAANPAPYDAPVNVRSNVGYTIKRDQVSNTFPPGMLSVNLPADMNGVVVNPKANGAAGVDWAQTFTLDLRPGGVGDWADPGSYSAEFLYTTVP
jgi:hypothetical protein